MIVTETGYETIKGLIEIRLSNERFDKGAKKKGETSIRQQQEITHTGVCVFVYVSECTHTQCV